ncbi:3-hydroxyacyl-CoA dehydrogenase [Actinomadura rayongensis]|uniref:3-hydroxyacyl-CoA dehydrogenase n=1 Tax=Actinomadura rayongensis TaxID=1429076 RepID=A0A6I4WDN1_9ACTN|nr:3-hydroxyacyl-CoA dehydrogenase [Actinomadura rayongensis]MXQ65114.1 3-hydroxyacyl-CoA dehydrogenase [Actinomadura rayongensis]
MADWAERVQVIRVIGTGAMGRGIAQWAAAGGVTVELADARPEAVAGAVEQVGAMFARLAAKGRMKPDEADAARARLRPVGDPLTPLAGCDLVVEAVREDLAVKRELFAELEKYAPEETVFATNTSSLSVTAIGAALVDPSRLAGLHFFNPVPLMKVVEVVPGARTAGWIPDGFASLVRRLGHTPVIAPDTPGFLVNHAGRGLATEALQILAEAVAEPVDVDRIARDVLGLKMGPFELMDLTGLDVSHPVLETIWTGFHGEPRLRPSRITRQRYEAGLLGRKTCEGFYRYTDGVQEEPPETAPDAAPRPVWIHDTTPGTREKLGALLGTADIAVETGETPSAEAVILVAPDDRAALDVALEAGLPPERTLGVDPFGGFFTRLTLAVHPGVDPAAGRAARAALAATGRPVTVVRDAPAPVAARLLASIVNVAAEIAAQRLATPADIDAAVRLGLGYPRGPLEWGDAEGAQRIHAVLTGLLTRTGDPRYRPSRWLTERAALNLPLTDPGTAPSDLD